MAEITRKDFLRLTSWGIIASLIPVDSIYAVSSVLSDKRTPNRADFDNAVSLAKEARLKFDLKDFAAAENLYLQAIRLAPSYIQFYDGLENVLGAQNRYLDIVMLFKEALDINRTKIAFYDRAARSLMRLETGNKRVFNEYKATLQRETLLNDAVLLYEQAIQIDNTKTYLNVGLEKVLLKIRIASLEADFRTNRVYKNIKAENRNIYKEALNRKSNEEIKQLIEKIDRKVRRPLIDNKETERRRINIIVQKKKFYDILQKRELPSDEKLENAESLFEIDYTDSSSLKRVKTAYYANHRFFEFIELRKRFADATKTVHGYLGLMDAMEMAYIKNQAQPKH